MLRTRSFIVLAVVTVAAAVGASLTLTDDNPIPQSGTPLFPALLAQVNDINEVEVLAGGKRFRLAREDRGWVAPERGGYPLDGDKVHKLLVGAARLVRIEPTTAKPELWPKLGLGDPEQADSRSVRFVMRDTTGRALADLIVGQRRASKADPSSSELFVREPDARRSWLVQGSLPDNADLLVDWLERRVAALGVDRVRSVSVTHPDGETVTVVRTSSEDRDFVYAQLPDGAEVAEAWRINDLGRLLNDLELDDVQPEADAPAPAGNMLQVEAQTFDGIRVQMQVYQSEEQHWARLQADPIEPAPAAEDASSAEHRRAEVERLNARWNGWIFAIPGYKAAYLSKRQADLVKQSEPKDEASEGTGDGGSG